MSGDPHYALSDVGATATATRRLLSLMKLFTGNLPWRPQGRRPAHSSSSVGRCWNMTAADLWLCACEDKAEAEGATQHHSATAGCMRVSIKVRASKDKSEASTKFEEYGPVIKHDDTVKDYAFVHMEWAEGAVRLTGALIVSRQRMYAQLSASCSGLDPDGRLEAAVSGERGALVKRVPNRS